MADVYCPLCGRKNRIPDGEESECFFCGAPLSPRTDSAQDAPPPKPEPETDEFPFDESPFIEDAMAVPFPDPSAKKKYLQKQMQKHRFRGHSRSLVRRSATAWRI